MNRSDSTPKFEGAVRRDFFDPKPSRPPAKSPTDWRPVALTAVLAAGFVSALAIVNRQEPPVTPRVPLIERLEQEPVAPPTPTAPTASPAPPAPVIEHPQGPLVLRAQPVEPVVRRALPVPGNFYVCTMPDGSHPLVRYMGAVRDFDALPKNPNLYDLYQIPGSGHSWVFMQPVGYPRASWIDP